MSTREAHILGLVDRTTRQPYLYLSNYVCIYLFIQRISVQNELCNELGIYSFVVA